MASRLLILIIVSIATYNIRVDSFSSGYSSQHGITNKNQQQMIRHNGSRLKRNSLTMYSNGVSSPLNEQKIPKRQDANIFQSFRRQQNRESRIVHRDTTNIGSLVVPSVGIGTISWSSKSITKLENLELQALVNQALQSDAALFDTAERYGSHFKTALGFGWGETEELLQKFIARSNCDKDRLAPVVATKFTPSPWRTTVESVVEACEQSCSRLGVENIDLYQLHMPDVVQPLSFLGKGAPKDEIYWDGLAECYKRGLVKNIGVSNYGPTLVSQCQEHLAKRGVPLASNQIAYSLIGRNSGSQDTLSKCSDLGVKVLACYPFAMGLLTGKYSSNTIAPSSNSVMTSLTSSKKTSLELKDLNAYAQGDGKTIPNGGIASLLQTMATIADNNEKTMAQVALNYIICKGAIPIPGSRSITQLEDNIGAMGWRLNDGEIDILEEAADKLGFDFEGAGFKRTSGKFVGYGVEKWSLD